MDINEVIARCKNLIFIYCDRNLNLKITDEDIDILKIDNLSKDTLKFTYKLGDHIQTVINNIFELDYNYIDNIFTHTKCYKIEQN